MIEDIFIVNDEYLAIDYEWVFDFQVPIEFILYRTICHFWNTNQLIKDFVVITQIFNHFNFDLQTQILFENWNANFNRYISNDIPLPKQKLISNDKLDIEDKAEEYLNLKLNPKNIHSSKIESLKGDIVLNQRMTIMEKNKEIEEKNREIGEKNNQIINKNAKIKNQNKKLKNNTAEIKKKDKQIKNLKKKNKELINSTSWKITKPLRKLKKMFK